MLENHGFQSLEITVKIFILNTPSQVLATYQ